MRVPEIREGRRIALLWSRQFKNELLRRVRMPMKRIGIRLGPQAGHVELVDNKIEGLAVAVSDLRKT